MSQSSLRHVLRVVLFAISVVQSKGDLISIPVSTNPIVQESCITISQTARFFYQMDPEFYSKVTVSDVARNVGKDISAIIKNKVGVLFLVAASSHVSRLLTLNNLIYPNATSKWSYQIPVQDILFESNGTITVLTDSIPIYKIQELAMKTLERRYGFSVNDVLERLHLKPMEFYGVDEKRWIEVVGLITKQVIKDRSSNLNLTPCYLAELINKTKEEMEKFTLNEVDVHLYNVNILMKKYPGYRNRTLSSLYERFNITAAQIAKMSNVKEHLINSMGLKSLLHLWKTTILKMLDLLTSSYEPGEETEIPCPSDWESFRKNTVQKAYKNAARSMSISSKTLASVIHISEEDVETFSFLKMMETLQRIIQPIKDDKVKIENGSLSLFIKNSPGLKNVKKHNAISLIKRVTMFSKHQLKLLYGWTSHDLHFARLYTLADLGRECKLNTNDVSLLLLARISIGELKPGINCQSFAALRLIWGEASLSDLKEIFKIQTRVALDKSIATIVSELTNSSTLATIRVLSNTPMIRWLLTKITLGNISTLTNYTTEYLKELPFQRIMVIIHEMHNAGLFDSIIDSNIVNYSSKVVSLSGESDLLPTNKQNLRQDIPTRLPRSSSSTSIPDGALLLAVTVVTLLSVYNDKDVTVMYIF